MSTHVGRTLALGLIAFMCFAIAGQSQLFVWKDASGTVHRTKDFNKLPKNLDSVRCHAKVISVLSGETFLIEGKHVVRLIGVDAPAGSLSWNKNLEGRAQRRLHELAHGKAVTLAFDRNFKNDRHETLVYAWTEDGTFLNTSLVSEGLAAWLATDRNRRHRSKLKAAAEKAKENKLGMWTGFPRARKATVPSAIKGFSLGLYSRQDSYDYLPFLKEQVAMGATDVLLITPWFLDHYTFCTMVPKEHRSCPLFYVGRVIRQARKLGLRVALMPIVLLWQPGDDHWRGNIEPRDLTDWFLSYQEFIGSFASLAQGAGANELIVGSEFSSLEKEESLWREVIAGVRKRFQGTLSYSANWDHLDTIKWWDALDAVGMTGYHSLTKKDDPTVEELVQAWRRIRSELEKTLTKIPRPYFFSEIGYASLDGINKNPWDYVSPEKVDNQEQADCFEAWFRAWQNPPSRFRGAFFYTWWRNHDADDKRQYTVHNKPAAQVIKSWYEK